MKSKYFYFLFIFMLLGGCSDIKSASEKAVVKPEEPLKEEVVALEKEEVIKILEGSLDSIYSTLAHLGEENGWNNSSPAEYDVIKPAILPFVTEEFADTTIKELSSAFYCECDRYTKPFFHHDVRFEYDQESSGELKIKALEPATEMNNMGTLWEFVYMKDGEEWKLASWNAESLENEDLQLSKEEAEAVLTNKYEVPEYKEEYDSEEAGGTAYLFTMARDDSERLVAISSRNTEQVYDFKEEVSEPTDSVSEEVAEDAQETEVPEVTIPSITGSNKGDYLAELDQVEASEIHREYKNEYQLLEDYALNHQLWDGVLNEIYGVLKTILSEAEMNDLKNEQRQWIKDRDEKVEAMPGYEEAGSLGRAEKVEAKFQITKERCYELVNNYME